MLPDGLRVNLVQRLEDKLHERAVAAARRGLAPERACLVVEVHVPPEPARECLGVHVHAADVGVESRERVEGKRPAVLCRTEAHAPFDRVRERRVLVSPVGSLDDGVDLLEGVPNLVVRVRGWKLELEDEPVHLVDEDADGQTLLRRVLDQALRAAHHTLHRVDHEHHAVAEAVTRGDLVAEVDVARGVHHVEEQVLPRAVGHHQRHGHRLDAHLPVLLVQPGVRVTQRPVVRVHDRVVHVMRLLHQHVEQRRLAVVQVPGDCHVANQIGVAHQAPHVLLVHLHHQRVLTAVRLHLLLLHRRDDGLLQGLRVLVHDERLRSGSVNLLRGWVVLLVLGQHDGRLEVLLGLVAVDVHARGAVVGNASGLIVPRVILFRVGDGFEGLEVSVWNDLTDRNLRMCDEREGGRGIRAGDPWVSGAYLLVVGIITVALVAELGTDVVAELVVVRVHGAHTSAPRRLFSSNNPRNLGLRHERAASAGRGVAARSNTTGSDSWPVAMRDRR